MTFCCFFLQVGYSSVFKSTILLREIALRHGCSPVNLLHLFRTPFPKNTYGGLYLLCGRSKIRSSNPWHVRKWEYPGISHILHICFQQKCLLRYSYFSSINARLPSLSLEACAIKPGNYSKLSTFFSLKQTLLLSWRHYTKCFGSHRLSFWKFRNDEYIKFEVDNDKISRNTRKHPYLFQKQPARSFLKSNKSLLSHLQIY